MPSVFFKAFPDNEGLGDFWKRLSWLLQRLLAWIPAYAGMMGELASPETALTRSCNQGREQSLKEGKAIGVAEEGIGGAFWVGHHA